MTHYGQSLAELDDFDDTGLGPSSDEEDGNSGQLDKKIVSQMHFGGFGDEEEQEEGRPKSRAEIMKEIIAKSKMHKVRSNRSDSYIEAYRFCTCSMSVNWPSKKMRLYVNIWMKSWTKFEACWTRNQRESHCHPKVQCSPR